MPQLFRFREKDLEKIALFIAWPKKKVRTKNNRYQVTPMLVACVVLRLLASPNCRKYLELWFGLHCFQLSEILLKGLKNFVGERVELVIEDVQ